MIERMRNVLVLASVAGLAAAVITGATASPPQLPAVSFATTHEQPVAGRTFPGVAIMHVGPRIQYVTCYATIGHERLKVGQQKFYASGVDGPTAVICNADIPAGAHGSLTMRAVASTPPETTTSNVPHSWRIRP
jgi:hypothetical protein